MDFVTVASDFYPELQAYYEEVAVEWCELPALICEDLTPPCVLDFAPGDTVRLASLAEVLVLHPFTPGTHTVVAFAEFTFSGPLMLTTKLHVRPYSPRPGSTTAPLCGLDGTERRGRK